MARQAFSSPVEIGSRIEKFLRKREDSAVLIRAKKFTKTECKIHCVNYRSFRNRFHFDRFDSGVLQLRRFSKILIFNILEKKRLVSCF